MKVVKQELIKRTFPVMTILILLLVGSVSAVAYITIKNMDITVDLASNLESDLPSTLGATAGSVYNYNYNFTNDANRPTNFTMSLNLSQAGLTTNEARLEIYGNNSNLLSSTTTATTGTMLTTTPDIQLEPNVNFGGTVKIQFNSSADNGTYDLDLMLDAGTFVWE